MSELNLHASNSTLLPLNFQLTTLLQKSKDLYLTWYGCYKSLPKEHRYTIGEKIDTLLTEIIEAIASASFLKKEEKLSYVKIAIRKNDTVKIFLLILWETKSLDNKKYLAISEKTNEVGRMLGGWNGQLTQQNKTPLQKI